MYFRIAPPTRLNFENLSEDKIGNHFRDAYFTSKTNLTDLIGDCKYYPPSCKIQSNFNNQQIEKVIKNFIRDFKNIQKDDPDVYGNYILRLLFSPNLTVFTVLVFYFLRFSFIYSA